MLSALPVDGTRHGVELTAEAGAQPALRVEEIYDRYFGFVWRSVRRLGIDEHSAEDVTQEVFVVVHRRLGDFEARSSLRTWLFGIALGVVRNQRRSRRRTDALAAASRLEQPLSTEDATLAEREAREILYAVLDELGEGLREVFVLAELEQLSAPEIGVALGVPTGTVYSRLHAAREKFQQAAARFRARDGWRRP